MVTNLRHQKIYGGKIENFIKDLPENQQTIVKACCKAAGTKKCGMRYTLDWVYSCILMRIKGPKLYNHIRENNLMPLPSPSTLSRYIRNIDGGFGFKKEIFELLKEKCRHLKESERHGCLLIDEFKIKPTKKFDKDSMEFVGFVNLGDYTPNNMDDAIGDHALVIMFQSFAGQNVQALGCFLSKGNVSGEVESKIVLECLILCENSGLFIDVVTSDGASWNRSMWKHLGIKNFLEPWCEHPVDASRKLRMCSDFPHLIKCVRNILEKKKAFQTPEGLVLHDHFEKLLNFESSKQFKIAFKLTPSHIHPDCREKMCTRLAFQLFSNTTALALETYKHKQVQGFQNVDSTVAFCRRINKVTDIMNSSSNLTGLRYNSEEYKELEDFLCYLDLWEQCSPEDIFLSKSTFDGLKATISCTLELVEYLNGLGFQYLMTTRINQDHLEHFFGMMRSAGGNNSHPESLQVGQLFRLMSLYSLIEPPRGSNVSGGEMMKSLIKIGDLKEKRISVSFDIDINEGQLTEINEEFEEIDEAFAYFCGYISKSTKSSCKCEYCLDSIIGGEVEEFNELIRKKTGDL